MKITLKDGTVKEYAEAKSVYDIAVDISEGLARMATAGMVDGTVVDLRHMVDADCELSILTFQDKEGAAAYRHTTSHVLAEAVNVYIQMQNWQLDHLLMMDFIMILTANLLIELHWIRLKQK